MTLPLYFDGRYQIRSSSVQKSLYANVVLDIEARELKDRLFTYLIPDSLSKETFIGTQVLVPFGHRDMIGGYVVSLSETAPSGVKAKEIAEVVETDPLFDKDYVDFLHWIADYYLASLTQVIQAAVPADFNPRIKRLVKLNTSQLALRQENSHAFSDPGCRRIMDLLSETKGGAISQNALRQRFLRGLKSGQAQFHRALNHLRQDGFVIIVQESSHQVTPKTVTTVIWTGLEPQTPRQKAITSVLSRHGGQMLMKDLLEEATTTHATVKKMSELGYLEICREEQVRDPLKDLSGPDAIQDSNPLTLTDAQTQALDALEKALEEALDQELAGHHGDPWLLFGVTGSGKTEIYLRLIEKTLKAGRTALLLVPEISLTPQLARRLKSRFGEMVAVWHSALSQGERYDTWRRIKSGDVRVLLGARSAVLANVPNLGLIVLDEEHDGSYKQTSPSPRYHAKEVALEKARRHGALVVLGSATPDVGTFALARERGRILELPERVKKQVMPKVDIVDMRQEFANGNRSIFSLALTDTLTKCLERKEQAILLINRRGYASHVFCRACGYIIKCRNCSVSMVFHQPPGRPASYLACHHCGFRTGGPSTCPSCKSPFIKQYGLGTQRVEEEVKEKFPQASTLRLDSDIAQRKGAHEQVLESFAHGKADILIGTQMVSKGLDIPNVTVVGILAADAAFNLPDYRSVERGFQLLTQVAGRAGRGDRPGKVVLQTYNPEMPALIWSQEHNYPSFVEEELEARKSYEYPPFSQLIRVVVAGPDAFQVQSVCERLAEEISHYLEDALSPDAVKVMGPAPCLIERLRGRFRYHLLIKNLAGPEGRIVISAFLKSKRLAPGLTLAIDVDALDLL